MNDYLYKDSLLFLYSSLMQAFCLKTIEIEFALVSIPDSQRVFILDSQRVFKGGMNTCLRMSFTQVLLRCNPSIANKTNHHVSYCHSLNSVT